MSNYRHKLTGETNKSKQTNQRSVCATENTKESEMKNLILTAFAALGIILGTTALVSPANAALQSYDNPASTAGGEG